MTSGVRRIHVTPQTSLGEVLDEAAREPLELERNGRVFTLASETQAEETYDPQALISALDEVAGLITSEQAEAWKAYIYRAREEGTRPDA